jgi:pyruvate-ferredoxin/flavodoxin oxidoreductase
VPVLAIVASFPLARTVPFYDMLESKQKGTGGLLAITINPEACKGCNICVEVCPENALVTIKQDDEVVEKLRRNWGFWNELPDTDDRFINIRNLDEAIGVLPSLLLKKKAYRSMVGGDGACMGCGEKTTVHLVTSTVEALMLPRVARFVDQVSALIQELETKQPGNESIAKTIAALRDLHWRYTEGPSGRGRAAMGIANSTGCSSVWASTYPFNPYPFPWVNHLFQDSPSIAIGLFEGQMRKMADAFSAVRRARLLATDAYDAARDEPFFTAFDWQQFTDEEFALCPPIMAIGGDGAMLDIGFQNLSRLMASGKPLRVLVLDTQVYSNTGGQACTSGFTGQVADMSAYGKAQHGKQEVRKELALIALAHRGVFVHQSSQASASHLIGGLIKGLQTRRPAVFNIYTPCPVEHGLPDEWAPHSARLALESRAFPFLTYDPDGGPSIAECLSLEGNPSVDDLWPTYQLEYVDEHGEPQTMELPLTIADWAATEGRFKKHFKTVKDADTPFHEFVQLPAAEREGKTPFIYTVAADKTLKRLSVSQEIVLLAADRLLFWSQLRELAGVQISDATRESITSVVQADYDQQLNALRAEYEARLADIKSRYPKQIARRLAEGLLSPGNRNRTVADLLERAEETPMLEPITLEPFAPSNGGATYASATATLASPATVVAPATATALAPESVAVLESPEEEMGLEPYIDTSRCTTCNECTNLNNRMFAYNADKQAYIKDAKAGTYAQLVMAAEKCPAALIHPGTPLNPNEKDLQKWMTRAEPFN